MSEQEPTQLIRETDTLLVEFTQKIRATDPLKGQTSKNLAAASSADPGVLSQFDHDMSQGLGDGLQSLNPTLGKDSALKNLEERSSMWTARQRRLVWYYDNFGVIGLTYMIKEIARNHLLKETGIEPAVPNARPKSSIPAKRPHPSAHIQVVDSQQEEESCQSDSSTLIQELETLVNIQGQGHISWRRIFYDWHRDGQSRMLFYLSAVPQEVMRAILYGTLPARMTEPSFAKEFGRFVEVTKCPGTYSLYVARRAPHLQARASSPHPEESWGGLGLTLEELGTVHTSVRRYIDVDDTKYSRLAQRIDSTIEGCPDNINYRSQRRYGGGSDGRDFGLHKHFLAGLKSTLLEWAAELKDAGQEGVLKIPLSRCFVHVGVSSNPLARSTMHWTQNRKPSPIVGLVMAVLETAWPGRFDVKDHTYQIFRAVNYDDLWLVEILSSIISSAYSWDLGLSFAYAGSGGQAKPNAHLASRFVENCRRMRQDGLQAEQLKASVEKIDKVKDWQRRRGEEGGNTASPRESLAKEIVRLRRAREELETQLLALQARELEDTLRLE